MSRLWRIALLLTVTVSLAGEAQAGGFLKKLFGKGAECCEPAPEPVCCCESTPEPACCEPVPEPVCCEPAPEPVCCEPVPTCCEPAPAPEPCCAAVGGVSGGMVMTNSTTVLHTTQVVATRAVRFAPVLVASHSFPQPVAPKVVSSAKANKAVRYVSVR